MIERVTRYNLRAATQALNEHIPSEAQTYFEQAQGPRERGGRPTRLHISMGHGNACFALGDHEGALVSSQMALHMAWQLRERVKGPPLYCASAQAESR